MVPEFIFNSFDFNELSNTAFSNTKYNQQFLLVI
jgi:hypothetical protein